MNWNTIEPWAFETERKDSHYPELVEQSFPTFWGTAAHKDD